MYLCTNWKSFIAGILAGFIAFSGSAQVNESRYDLFTVNEGLPQNYLLGLAQDSAGFIWIGTKDGLARYDGNRFKIYRQGKDSLHTPAFNVVNNLYTDRRGYLWIQYDNRAIDCYDPSSGTFEHISNQPAWIGIRPYILSYELIVDRHDNLWVITEKGVYRYNTLTKQLSPFTQLSGIMLLGIMEDHSGKIWMVTQKGFYVYDYSKDRLQHIPFELSARQTYSGRNHKLGVGETASGKLIISSLDSTVLIYDPVNNSFQTIVPGGKKYAPYDSGLGNTNVVVANNGDRWFTCNGRIFRIDKQSDAIAEVIDPGNPQVPGASVLMIDRSGCLWFGKNAQGLCKINLNAARFVSKNYVNPNFETDILINELGLNANELPAGFNNAAFAYMFRHAIDTINRLIWIQNYLLSINMPVLTAYDIDSKKIITKNISLSAYGAVGITSGPAGNVWSIGINDWNPSKISYRDGKIDKQIVDIRSLLPDSLIKARIVAINPAVDKDMMWVMTASNGNIDFGAWNIVSIHLPTKQMRYYPLMPDNAKPASSLIMMVNDPSNQKYLWIGTTGNGLIRFDKTTGQSHAFTTDDGLPNNTIYAIVPDDNNNLWLSSNRGITRFNPVTHAIRNFDIADGLISNEFNRWHCFKLPDGRIAFGGITGYTIFNPADIKEDAFQPRILFSNLLINNKPLSDSSSLAGSLNAMNELFLPYDQNFLGFEFACDEYDNPRKITYRYRLINFDNDWVYAHNERFANYTRLPPGKYTLEINAANVSGIWSNKIKTLQIIITPPWWQSWWAYSLYILIAVGLIAAFFYYRLRQIRLKQGMILQQKQTEQLKAIDEMKSRFFSNITHEFRTPLSLIISPVEKLQADTKDEQTRKTLVTVQHNAERLLQLINQLLDLSKLEAGNMQLNFYRGRLNEFTSEMTCLFLPLAENKQIELTYRCDLAEEYLFDADKMKTIFLNLLSNAIKFTPAGGKIAVSVTEQEDKKIKLSVSDTGIGIPADKLPFIFNRFFQADDSRIRRYEGTGIGLALVKELAELMNGTVSAESRDNTGTLITLTLPIEKATETIVFPHGYQQWQKEKDIVLVPATKTIHTNGHAKETVATNLPLLLLVEDNEELLAFLRESFERTLPGGKAGFRVITASNGLSALALAKEELPDVIISDIMMPEMDGYALCSRLKTDAVTNHIAVILLSARASYESRLGGLQLGADDYISKPFHFDELETRIRNLLERQERLRAKYRSQLQQQDPVAQQNEIESPFLKNIYDIIEDMIDDPQLGASKLAEKNAMSLRTLNRKLNTLIGLTAGDLIRQYRLQKSLSLLKTGHNVSEAAYMVGFETPAYFSQCFKDHFGVSPKDYFADAK
jgi:signal transduction histidine kinase/ligand-binding sensor domain-containing protein/DNA-binding NarL/FixJ family response regulator